MASSNAPADKPAGVPAAKPATAQDDNLDDNGDAWRHPPVAPKDEGPLKSFARSVSETVTGSRPDKADKPDKPKA